jgi:sporulation protein YlmC with PRC-barrel domain
MSDITRTTNAPAVASDETHMREGMAVETSDGPWGEVADIVIDPIHRRVTHLVVQPHGRHDRARLVPISAVRSCDDHVELSWTAARMRTQPMVQQTSFISVGHWPELAPGWDVGVSELGPWIPNPLLNATGFGYATTAKQPMATTTYDRVPHGSAELRKSSAVVANDGHVVGHVYGFVVGRGHDITHLVLERGLLWARREITIPVDDIKSVASDSVRLRVKRDALGRYPSVPSNRNHRAPVHS